MSEPRNSDTMIEVVLGNLLRAGTMLSAIVIALGGIAYLWVHGGETPHYKTFRGEPPDLRSIAGVAQDVLKGRAVGVIQLGMLLLVATPIARVVGALVAFAVMRDRKFVVILALVLAALLYSLLAS